MNNHIKVKDSAGNDHFFNGPYIFYHAYSTCRVYDPVSLVTIASFTNPIAVLMEAITNESN